MTLSEDYLKLPQTEQESLEIATKTFDRWQFPNAIAAANGKH